MCYNCGCFTANDDMGHPNNITDKTFKKLAKKWRVSPHDAKHITFNWLTNQTIESSHKKDLEIIYQKASKAWGQTIKEAKDFTIDLLQNEIH